MLQFEEIRQLLLKIAQQQTVSAEDTPVLLIGTTGSGKSTLTNYLLGWHMQINEHGEATPVESSAPMLMSGSGESVTLVPKLQRGIDNTLYCDCSGFLDNRSDEVRICASVATEHIIKTARHIAGIIVVIDYESIQASRGAGFLHLLQNLAIVFHSIGQHSGSIVYVLNKVPERLTKVAILRKLQDILSTIQAREGQTDAALVLGYMLKEQQHILIANVFDQGASRVEIMRTIRSLQPLASDALDFQHSDPLRNELRNLLDHIVVQGLEKKEHAAMLPKNIQHLDTIDNELLIEIDCQREAMAQYYSKQSHIVQAGVLAQEMQRLLTDNSDILAVKQKKRRVLEKQSDDLLRDYAFLDSNEPVLYWEQYHNQKARLTLDAGGEGVAMLDTLLGTGGLIPAVISGWNSSSAHSTTKISFDYPGPASVDIEKKAEGGSFISERENKKSGALSLCFEGKNDTDQCASVRIFIERRHDPKNIKKMTTIEQQRVLIQEEIAFVDREITYLHEKSHLHQEAFDRCSAQHQEKQSADLVTLIQTHIEMLQERQQSVCRQKSCKRQALLQVNEQLQSEQGLYEVTADLLALLSGIDKNDVNAQKFIELFSSADVIEAPPLQEEKKSGNAMSLEALYQDMAKMQKQILELQREVATLHKRIKLTTPLNQSDQSQTSEPTFFRKSF